jgi:hypothetical protein
VIHVSVRHKSKLNDPLVGSTRISLPEVAASSESTALTTAPLNTTPAQFLSSVLAFSSPAALGENTSPTDAAASVYSSAAAASHGDGEDE